MLRMMGMMMRRMMRRMMRESEDEDQKEMMTLYQPESACSGHH